MKTTYYILIFTLFIQFSSTGQTNEKSKNQMENYELSPETAHPKAKELLKDDFYWSPIDECAPFGNDDGSDAFYGFRKWRLNNNNKSPVKFIEKLLNSWDYPKFDLYEMDTEKIKTYISSKTQVDTSGINAQMPELIEQFKQMAKKSGQEFNEEQFKQLIAQTSDNMGGTFLYGIDNSIIAIGFGQYMLEGTIDSELKTLTEIAIKRELLPVLVNKWGEHKSERIKQLNKMLAVVNKMN